MSIASVAFIMSDNSMVFAMYFNCSGNSCIRKIACLNVVRVRNRKHHLTGTQVCSRKNICTIFMFVIFDANIALPEIPRPIMRLFAKLPAKTNFYFG